MAGRQDTRSFEYPFFDFPQGIGEEQLRQMQFASTEYLRLGIGAFHDMHSSMISFDDDDLPPLASRMQAVTGNLLISLELMAAFVVATIDPGSLTHRAKLFPDNRISSAFDATRGTRDHTSLVRALNRVVETQEYYQKHAMFLEHTKDYRDQCVHSFYNPHNEHLITLLPCAAMALELAKVITVDWILPRFYEFTEKDRKFLDDYDVLKAKAVQEKVRVAFGSSRTQRQSDPPRSNPEAMLINCPICGGNALLRGSCGIREDVSGTLDPLNRVGFWAEELVCQACGLDLSDKSEMLLFNLPVVYEHPYYKDYEDLIGDLCGDDRVV